MTKSSAFGTQIKKGVQQIETAVVVGTITTSGNATFTVTKSGLTGSPLAVSVAVLDGDTADTVTTRAVAALNADGDFSAVLKAEANGSNLIVTTLTAAANDATMNIAYTNDTCAGLTPDATSNDTLAGSAFVTIAQVKDISGPGLAADTEDVTTHDSTAAFEEVVATILRTGELTFEIEYDPNGATHDASTGLVYSLENKEFAQYQVVFPGPYTWTFNAYVTGFEPGEPVEGSLTASVGMKLTGQPTLV